MWERIRRELLVEYYWWRRQNIKKKRLDSPAGIMGILLIGAGIFLMILFAQGIAALLRSIIPVVNGTQIAGAYWSSVFLAIKISLGLIILLVGVVFYIIFKVFGRRL
ncbi:hypothetical protein LPY66_02715 [Dehalobacter sp. DCM]|uniref:hypothetical protein n=1 Tax=Dehalobacter sp. DCM TaxID=2907827 RepID=UPI003081C4AF|nr:hypothetical protein LPY66_02715 [Dehalobacter sp. DCM]